MVLKSQLSEVSMQIAAGSGQEAAGRKALGTRQYALGTISNNSGAWCKLELLLADS